MKHNMYIVIRNIKFFFAETWKVKKSYIIYVFIQLMLKTLTPFVSIIFPKLIIDELLSDMHVSKLILLVVSMVVIGFILKATHEVLKCTIENLSDFLSRHFEVKIGKKSLRLDYQHIEDVTVLNQKEKAWMGMDYSGGVEGLTNDLMEILSSFFILVGVTTIVLSYSPWLALIILITAIITTIFHSKIGAIGRKYFLKLSTINRQFEYVFFELPQFRYGKDVRLYDASSIMEYKGETYRKIMYDHWGQSAKYRNRWHQPQIYITGILDIISYTYIGALALIGRFGVGTFTMLIASTTALSQSITSIIHKTVDIKVKSELLNEYINYLEYPDVLEKNNRNIVNHEKHIIEFKNVSFKYPKTDRYVLQNINLSIKPGERLSIVGLNGEGKTTFIKLLTRLYDVSDGEILLDGINIKNYEYKEYQDLFSVVFQDFRLFAFSIKENIWIDRKPKDFHTIVDCAGLKEKVDSLPDGIETSVYKDFDENGCVPSGGEAQKIAIARALAKKSSFVILDEPTSALDPIAEFELYTHFDKLVEKKTSIYISHRLSSCKFADRILLFHESELQEAGTHDELIMKNGIYAKMFNIQAEYYKTE